MEYRERKIWKGTHCFRRRGMMGRLSMDQVLKDKQSGNHPNSVTSLSLTHRALSDVSCLTQFTNLEKLDLAFNTLTSLDGLKSCINLKWLSLVQNKLLSLKGIESLSKLTVFNAGKNKLNSIDEVRSLVSLRALILNDNEIVSICKLDQLKDLNTLVLSRNPICEIGESLVKVKSLTKLSLSNCQLQTIGSSLKSCIELKELRLAHNEIKTLPAELAYNKKLQNLDLGNNVIARCSDVKVLNSLVDLKNLNLQGNPITEMDKLSKKVLKLAPNLHIFNAKLLDRGTKKGGSARVDDLSPVPANEFAVPKEKQKDSVRENELSRREMDPRKSGHHDNANDAKTEKMLKKKNKKPEDKMSRKEDVPDYERDDIMVEKKLKRKKSQEQGDSNGLGEEENVKQRRKKTKEVFKDVQVNDDENNVVEKRSKSKKSRDEQGELDVIDNRDASFADLFAVSAVESPEIGGEKKMLDKAGKSINLMGGVVTINTKKKKTKNHGVNSTVQLPAAVEVGMGGPSTWGDE